MSNTFRHIRGTIDNTTLTIRETTENFLTYCFIQPFINFVDIATAKNTEATFKSFYNMVLRYEITMRPTGTHRNIRNSLQGFESLPPFSQVLIEEKFVNGNRQQSTSTQVSIVFLIYWCCSIIAYSPEIRTDFIHRFLTLTKVPKFLRENFLRVRISRCGPHYIVPSCDSDYYDKLRTNVPGFAGSLYDPAYLCSSQGIDDFCNIINTVLTDCPTYFKTVDKLDFVQVAYDSGYTTTQCALTISETNPTLVSLLQFCSFKDQSPLDVHVHDCVIQGQLLQVQDTNGTVPTSSRRLEVTNVSLFSASQYVCQRIIGLLDNSNGLPPTHPRIRKQKAAQTAPAITKIADNNPPSKGTVDQNLINSIQSLISSLDAEEIRQIFLKVFSSVFSQKHTFTTALA